jgi:hypothetical protein
MGKTKEEEEEEEEEDDHDKVSAPAGDSCLCFYL